MTRPRLAEALDPSRRGTIPAPDWQRIVNLLAPIADSRDDPSRCVLQNDAGALDR